MYQSHALLVRMFTAAIFLMLIHLEVHGTDSHGEGTCSTEKMRRAFMDEKLADLDCGNYTCCM